MKYILFSCHIKFKDICWVFRERGLDYQFVVEKEGGGIMRLCSLEEQYVK